MNKNAFDVFLQKQRDNEEINEIAALGRLAGPAIRAMAKTKPKPRVVGKPAVPGAGRTGVTRAAAEKAKRPEFTDAMKTKLLARGIDPGRETKEMPGRAARLAKAAELTKRKDQPVRSAARSAMGSGSRLAMRGLRALKPSGFASPQNRELAKRAVKGVAAFAKRGGFSSGFNQLYKDDIPTGYRSAGGAITPGRLIGVGTQAGDEAAIDRARAEREGPAGSGSPSRDPFAGLSPVERRKARTYGAATGT